MQNLTDDDVGKTVLNREGNEIGRVTRVEGDTAFVDPNPDVSDSIMARLGWEDADEDDYRLDMNEIETITDDEIRLS